MLSSESDGDGRDDDEAEADADWPKGKALSKTALPVGAAARGVVCPALVGVVMPGELERGEPARALSEDSSWDDGPGLAGRPLAETAAGVSAVSRIRRCCLGKLLYVGPPGDVDPSLRPLAADPEPLPLAAGELIHEWARRPAPLSSGVAG